MPTIETLGRIMNSPSQRLKVRCDACGHASQYPRADAWAIWGMHATPHSIRRRAKCLICGERTLISVTI
jgi:hypothetical protein